MMIFYKDMYDNTKYAATKILNLLNDLTTINSVVVLGCGIGARLCCAKNVFFGADCPKTNGLIL